MINIIRYGICSIFLKKNALPIEMIFCLKQPNRLKWFVVWIILGWFPVKFMFFLFVDGILKMVVTSRACFNIERYGIFDHISSHMKLQRWLKRFVEWLIIWWSYIYVIFVCDDQIYKMTARSGLAFSLRPKKNLFKLGQAN